MTDGASQLRVRAAEVWRVRERTEHEVSALFSWLAAELEAIGAPPVLHDLAKRAADDELVHAEHCRRVIDALVPNAPPLAPAPFAPLGPAALGREQRALYASVALGCITETLSTALLFELRRRAEPEGGEAAVVRDAFDVILRDEVQHGRLGWAHLAWARRAGDVSFLSEHVPAMIAAARAGEAGAAHTAEGAAFLVRWGVLPVVDVDRIVSATITATILPGLAQHGVAPH